MKKRIAVVMVIAMVLAAMVSVNAFAKQQLNITLDGKVIRFTPQPFLEKGRVMVPLDALAEVLGAQVTYDKKEDCAWFKKDKARFQITAGKNVMYIHREDDFTGIPQEVKVDVAAKWVKGILYVPLRFMAEGLGMTVAWEPSNYRVVLKSESGILPVEAPVGYEKLSPEAVKDLPGLADWLEENGRAKGIYYKTIQGETYVLISAGQKPTGGYSIEVESATQVAPGTVYITARVIHPAPDAMVTQALTYPQVLLKLQAKDIKEVQGDILDEMVRSK